MENLNLNYNMPMSICVLSKGRPDIFEKKTYKLLKRHQLLEWTTLFVSKEDAVDYSRFKLPIVVSPDGYVNCCNFITDYYEEGHSIILMADDLIEFYHYDGSKNVKIQNLLNLILNMIYLMSLEGINLAGVYPNNNPLFLRGNKKDITTDLRFIHDAFCIIINKKIYLDEKINKADFQRTIEYYKLDGKILRYNKYSFDTKFNKGKGGNEEEKLNEKKYADLFYEKYKDFIQRRIYHKSGTSSFVLRKGGGIPTDTPQSKKN